MALPLEETSVRPSGEPAHLELSRYDCVLFDVDGTLIDSNRAHAEAWTAALREHGVPAQNAFVRRLIGMGSDKLLPETANVSEDSPEGRAIAARKKAIFATLLPGLTPTQGARELLEHLRDRGMSLVVATSAGTDEMQALLLQAGLDTFFARRTSNDDAEGSKPDPDIIFAALSKARTPAERALMIGDTPYDVRAASEAGVVSIALRCGGYWSDQDLQGALAIFDHPADVLERCGP